jgi:hypothetical protein
MAAGARHPSDRSRSLPAALAVLLAGLAVAEAVVTVRAQSVERPVRAVTDPGVVKTRQAITPAGVQSGFEGEADRVRSDQWK